jgi:beta-N-acetylhexosaminidase
VNPTVPHHRSLVRTGAAVVVLALVTVLVGAGPGGAALATTTATTPPAAWQQRGTPGWTDDQAVRGWITRKLHHMTLAEKVGQLFVTYAYGETADTT